MCGHRLSLIRRVCCCHCAIAPGLLHAAKHTYNGFVAVDFGVTQERPQRRYGLPLRRPPPQQILTVNIVFTGKYPQNELSQLVVNNALSLRRLVESNSAAPVLTFSSYSRFNASSWCCGHPVVPHTSTYRMHNSDVAQYQSPEDVLLDLVSSPEAFVIDSGEQLHRRHGSAVTVRVWCCGVP